MPPPSLLCAGLATLDLVQRVEVFPGPNEKVTSLDASLDVGGPAAAAAVTAAALGSEVTLRTALGEHPIARVLHERLSEHGVTVRDATPDARASPPVSAVTVEASTGERSVVSRNATDGEGGGVGAPFDVESAKAVLVDGHHRTLAEAAVAEAARYRVPVILDAGSWKPVFERILPAVDFAVCSADFRAPNTDPEPAEQADELMRRGVGAVAVTRGGAEVLWWLPDDHGAVPVPEVEAVDTLGAGDVFHGAVAHAFAGGNRELPDVLGFAVEIASDRVRYVGRNTWLHRLIARRAGNGDTV